MPEMSVLRRAPARRGMNCELGVSVNWAELALEVSPANLDKSFGRPVPFNAPATKDARERGKFLV